MIRQAVQSSNIKSVGYDESRLMLEVEFHGGAIWQYTGVQKILFDEFLKAESKGGFFAARIRHNIVGVRVDTLPKNKPCLPGGCKFTRGRCDGCGAEVTPD